MTQYAGRNESLNLVDESAGRLRWRGRRPEDGVDSCLGRATADDLSQVVDAEGQADCVSRQSSEVRHHAVLPEEGVGDPWGRGAVADDLPQVVDAAGNSDRSAQNRE